MYSALYRILPGGPLLKWLQLTVLAAGFVAVLFYVVFPYVDAVIAVDPVVNG